MTFTAKPQTFSASIGSVCFGDGAAACTIGGNRILPLCFFDGPAANRPAVGVEITDLGFDFSGLPLLAAAYAATATVGELAQRAASFPGADFVCLRFEGADPNGANRSVADCVADAKAAAACGKPLAIAGCKNMEKDSQLFTAIAEALQGENILFLSAREEDYKAVGAATALAYGHKTGAESAVDINLAKQLNVLLCQLGVSATSLVMNLGSAAAGYGFEYVSSTMDRVKAAALEQNDAMLQMPVITPVSAETWTVKETVMRQEDMPEWGDLEQRGMMMEAATAAACLASGADAVILRHPAVIEKVAALLAALQ